MTYFDERNELIAKYLPLVDSTVNYFKGNDTGINTLDDLYQEGCIGLIKAVERGDPNNPYYETYLRNAIWNKMMRKIELSEKFDEHEILPDAEYDEFGDDISTGIPSEKLTKVEPNTATLDNEILIGCMKEKVKDAECKVRNGLDFLLLELNGYSQSEIAKMYNLKDSRCVSAYICKTKKFFRQDKEFKESFGW